MDKTYSAVPLDEGRVSTSPSTLVNGGVQIVHFVLTIRIGLFGEGRFGDNDLVYVLAPQKNSSPKHPRPLTIAFNVSKKKNICTR